MTRDLLIGTYTESLPHVDGHAEGILSARFDGDTVSPPTVAARLPNPSWLAASADGTRVYAVTESSPEGRISAFAREASGTLTPLGDVPSGGADPAHLAVHPSGRLLLAGTYSGGTASVFALEPDGSIGPRTAFVQHEGHGPGPARQEAPHVHQLTVDPVTGDVVVVDLGLGEVRWYALSPEGRLTLRPSATVALGAAGPRHLAFHPAGGFAFLVGELDSTLAVLRREGERFVVASAVSTRPAGATGPNLPAAVRVTADGTTVLVTNRGDDTVAVFAFDALRSSVSLVASVPSGGRSPRDLVVAPGGDRVLVANQDSDGVAVFAFDPGARELRLLDVASVPTPVCLVFPPSPLPAET